MELFETEYSFPAVQSIFRDFVFSEWYGSGRSETKTDPRRNYYHGLVSRECGRNYTKDRRFAGTGKACNSAAGCEQRERADIEL